MQPQSIRMPTELWEELVADAEEKNRTAAEHVREICRAYLDRDLQEVHGRLDDLERRVHRLEQSAGDDEELAARVDRLEREMERLAEVVRTEASGGGRSGRGGRAGEERGGGERGDEERGGGERGGETRPAEMRAGAERAGEGREAETQAGEGTGGASADLAELERRVEELEEMAEERRAIAPRERTASAAGDGPARAADDARAAGDGADGTSDERAADDPATAAETAEPARPESVEDVDDVVRMAVHEHGGGDLPMRSAGREALERLRESGPLPESELRADLVEEHDPDDPEEVWWAETVRPVVETGIEWGVVVPVHGDELEWIGSPSGHSSPDS